MGWIWRGGAPPRRFRSIGGKILINLPEAEKISQRLQKIDDLFGNELITQDQCADKRQEILAALLKRRHFIAFINQGGLKGVPWQIKRGFFWPIIASQCLVFDRRLKQNLRRYVAPIPLRSLKTGGRN